MSKMIDSPGTYRGTVLESKFDYSTNGCPQAILKLSAAHRYTDEPEWMAKFQITEPDYVDWSSYEETIVGFFVMFKAGVEIYNDETKLKNYDQLKLALGWDGLSFEPLNEGVFVGKEVMYRVESKEYNGKQRIQVSWIDAPDAPPTRNLAPSDPATVKAATAKLQFAKPAVKPAAAKPVTAAKKPANPTQAATAVPAAKPTAHAAVPNTSKTVTSPSKVAVIVPARTDEVHAAPQYDPCSKVVAWTEISDPDGNGNADATLVETVWNETINAVAGAATPDEQITDAQWGEIRVKGLERLNKKG
jgi:hypothetical protein